MDNLAIKQGLLDKCKEVQLKVIENLRSEMADAQKSANEYGPPRDRYDAYRMQMLRKKDMFAQMLVKAMNEYKALEQLNAKKTSQKAEFGSVVITADQKIFISTAIGKIEYADQSWFAVSLMVPLAQAIIGRKKGEEFTFRGKTSMIIELF